MDTCLFAERGCRAKLDSSESVCFLAAPCADEVQERVDMLIGAAEDVGLRCLVAERHQEFNRDVFCEKICRPIIESRLCLVLLDASPGRPKQTRSHNPNVFYEYGLMSALRKCVLAFVPKRQEIPFNVRHLDLIPYEGKALRLLARRKLQQAIEQKRGGHGARTGQKRRKVVRSTPLLVRSAHRILELQGCQPSLPGVVGENAARDTSFEPYFGESELVFLTYVGDDGVSADEARKDALFLARRLEGDWENARVASQVATSRGWKAIAARTDMERLKGSRILVVSSLGPQELSGARSRLGESVDAGFRRVPVDVWGQDEISEEEIRLGLG